MSRTLTLIPDQRQIYDTVTAKSLKKTNSIPLPCRVVGTKLDERALQQFTYLKEFRIDVVKFMIVWYFRVTVHTTANFKKRFHSWHKRWKQWTDANEENLKHLKKIYWKKIPCNFLVATHINLKPVVSFQPESPKGLIDK